MSESGLTPEQREEVRELASSLVAYYLQPQFIDGSIPADGQAMVWESDRGKWQPGVPSDTVAHGTSRHTEFTAWRVFYTDASGDQQEIALGADGTVLLGKGATTAPAFGKVDLTADVENDLPIAEGGTGQSTQQAAIDALTAVSGATNEHVLTKDTGTGNAIFKAAAGGGGAHDLLDGSTVQDSVAQAVTEGSLIIGNATPKWDELVIGADHTVLVSNGTTASWSAAPPLAGIADTGDTTRIALATGSPHVTVTGTLQVSQTIRTDSGVPNTNVSGFFGNSAWPYGKVGLIGYAGSAPGPTANWAVGIQGQVLFTGTGTDPVVADGLVFTVGTVTVTGTHTFAEVNAMYLGSLWVGATGLTVTLLRGIHIDHFSATFDQIAACTTMYGIQINATATAKVATAYGVWLGDNSGATTAGYGIYIEDQTSSNTARIMELENAMYVKGTGEWTAAANETPVWIYEGATPTVRQVQWVDADDLTAGDKVMVLV